MNRCERTLARLVFVVLATATAASWAQNDASNQGASRPQGIAQGDIFVLLMPIELARGKTAAYLQAGRVVAEEVLGADDPVCRLARRGSTLTTIQPQRFRVTNVTYDEQAQGRSAEARATTTIELSAENDGATDHMACWWPGASAGSNFVAADDIGATLGPYFSIEVPNN